MAEHENGPWRLLSLLLGMKANMGITAICTITLKNRLVKWAKDGCAVHITQVREERCEGWKWEWQQQEGSRRQASEHFLGAHGLSQHHVEERPCPSG